MSVLVKGWTIPKGCADCPTWCKLYLQRREFRHPDCPLIEVPTPHGRLIDADELKTAFPVCDNSMNIKIASVRATINHMPTVIEAED